nr:MAG TPA: Exonuclease I [Inoviridae sp.]
MRFEQSLQALAAQHANNEEKLILLQKVYEYGIKLIG